MMLKRLLLNWGLLAAVFLAGVSVYVFLQNEARGRQVPRLAAPIVGEPGFDAAFGSAVRRWTAAADGGYFIVRQNGLLQRHDPLGAPRWTLDLATSGPAPGMEAASVAASRFGELFVLGLTEEPSGEQPRMILTKIVEGAAGPVPSVVREYEGMEPAGLAVAGDGRFFLAAAKVARINHALGCGVAGEEDFEPFSEPYLYEADETGRLIRPILSASFDPANPEVLEDWSASFWETRVALDPDDNPYLYRVSRPALEKIDPVEGRVAGTMALSHAGFWDSVRLDGLQFVDDGRVLYTLHRIGSDRLFLGTEARIMDLATGESLGLEGFGDPAPPGFAVFDSASRVYRGVAFSRAASPLALEVAGSSGRDLRGQLR